MLLLEVGVNLGDDVGVVVLVGDDCIRFDDWNAFVIVDNGDAASGDVVVVVG